MRVKVISKVYSDIESAMDYYAREGGYEIAREFYGEFHRCRQIISRFAQSYPIVQWDIRRINFRRFPYHILYRITDQTTIRIIAVKHDRRDPDFGLDR